MGFPARRTAIAACLAVSTVLAPAVALAAPAGTGPGTIAGPGDAAGKQMPFQQIKDQLQNHSPSAKLLMAAHRGQWRDAPENSLAAIDKAIKDGAEIVEIDVQLTKDGVPVLMHDATVDRTTNGSGKVSDLTLAQIQDLRLQEGLGGDDAAVTGHTVPTLEEAMAVVKDRAMVNLDKGWAYRAHILEVLQETGTVDHGIFKGSPTVPEAEEFMAQHEDILYMHIVNDATAQEAFAFEGRQPVAVEVVFDKATDPQAQPGYLDRLAGQSRVWVNTMWGSLAADNTDEASLRLDPELGWDTVATDYRATMLQTDNVEPMDYWRDGGPLHLWDRQPGANTVRIQAETPADGGQGVGYSDNDANRCATISPDEPMLDICDQRGARVLGWIRGGEWVEYEFTVGKAGTYAVSARVSSPYSPAGTADFTWDGERGARVAVGNTTNHNAFERQAVETREFSEGTHRLRISMPAGEYQNFNIDYIQLDAVK